MTAPHTLRIVAATLAMLLLLAACSGVASPNTIPTTPADFSPGNPVAGAKAYRAVCANCHGIDLAGVAGLGQGLVPSSFITDRTDEELVAFIIEGRPIDHPDNITGVAMLPRGGNPSLSDQDIADIVAYLRAQQ